MKHELKGVLKHRGEKLHAETVTENLATPTQTPSQRPITGQDGYSREIEFHA